jgi:nucleotide-binding universal stress UspA family protein
MLQAFRNILVPVDFTLNTEVAINKSLELIDEEGSAIHLLHVNKSGYSFKKGTHFGQGKKLAEWKESIEDYHPSISVQIAIKEAASVQIAIKEKAEEIGADLIVIGQTSSHNWLPVLKTVLPMHLAASTQIPVLTVKPGALHNKPKTVVVPIADEIPNIKILALELLCKKVRLNVHLVTFVDDRNVPSEFSASALLQVYQWLKAKLHCPVEYAVMHGPNRAKAILQYAEKNNADILLVYPKKETQLGWWNQHIPDVLPAHSKVQVLAVQPAVHEL